jgi:hypothetical protein
MPDLAFLILEIRAFSEWPTIRAEAPGDERFGFIEANVLLSRSPVKRLERMRLYFEAPEISISGKPLSPCLIDFRQRPKAVRGALVFRGETNP